MSSLGGPLQTTGRNIWALVLRDMQTQFGSQSLGYIWALMEPLGMIAALSAIFYFAGRTAPLGENAAIFFATGVIPLRTYSGTIGKVRKALVANKNLLFFPIIKPLDAFIAPVFLQTATMSLVLLLFFVFYYLAEGTGLPDDWFNTFLPFAFFAIYAFSLGIINAVIGHFISFWDKLWKMLNRPVFLLSGIFYLLESMPMSVQRVLYYNPFAHCIEWARSGYYAGFESDFVDPYYIFATMGILLFTALLLERMFRRQLLSS